MVMSISQNRNARKQNLVSECVERISQKLSAIPKDPKAFLRRKLLNRRSLIALSLSVAFLFVCGVTGAAGRMADKMILYVHIAGLYAKSPDTNLSMPLKDVKTSQIAN